MFKLNTVIAISLLGLTACGGGGGGTPAARAIIGDGVFKDSNVTGLSFVSGNQNGITDAGKFKYEIGEDVNFTLGGIDFGSALGKPVMTPIDLVEGGKLSDVEVVNRVRLLMMLDEDNTPSNGIDISSKVQDKAKEWVAVDFSAVNFLNEVNTIQLDATAEDGIAHALPSSAAAVAHMKTTLLCSSAGAFVGNYTGSENGNIAFMVDPVSGEVKGSSFDTDSQESNQQPYEVNSQTEIAFEDDFSFVTSEDSAKNFSGKLNSSNDMEGSWVNSADDTKTGAFVGARIGGSSDAIYRYTVTFSGNNSKGLYTFDVASNNAITGIAYNVGTKAESEITGTLVDNTLEVTVADGTEIDGVIDETTHALSGVWSNVSALDAGTFTGGGCKLN